MERSSIFLTASSAKQKSIFAFFRYHNKRLMIQVENQKRFYI